MRLFKLNIANCIAANGNADKGNADKSNMEEGNAEKGNAAYCNNAKSNAALHKPRPRRIQKQLGMTMIELMVVVAILGILAAFVMSKMDTSTSKATRLFNDMNTTKGALLRAKTDMGAIPSNLTVLWIKANATGANMFGGLNGTVSWNGGYMEPQPVDSVSAIKSVAIADAATINIAREAAAATTNGGNYTWVYFLRANNVPNSIIYKFLKQCSGSEDAATVSFVNAPCRAVPGTGSSEFGTVDLRVDDTY